MVMNVHPQSKVIDDHIPALSPHQSHACQATLQRRLGVLRYFLNCLNVARQRRDLLALDDAALRDIGVSRIDALTEAKRDFWDIPEALKRFG